MRTGKDPRGFTLIELLIVVAIVATIIAIAVPNLMAARMSGNEASAIGAIRTIASAEATYAAQNNGFADDLAALATTCPGSAAPFLSADLNVNGVLKSGYRFQLAPGQGAVPGPLDCNGTQTQSAFYATALPLNVGSTGRRGFATNMRGAVWQDTSGVPPSEPFAVTATSSPVGQ